MAGILSLLLTCACLSPPQDPALKLPQPPGGDTASLREKLHNGADPKEQTRAALLLIQSTSPETLALVKFELKSPRADRPEVFQALAGAIRLCRDVRISIRCSTPWGRSRSSFAKGMVIAPGCAASWGVVRRFGAAPV